MTTRRTSTTTESTSQKKDKVVWSLDYHGGLRTSRYGDVTKDRGDKEPADMVHMRGASGKMAYTVGGESEGSGEGVSEGSGGAELSTQGRRGKGGGHIGVRTQERSEDP